MADQGSPPPLSNPPKPEQRNTVLPHAKPITVTLMYGRWHQYEVKAITNSTLLTPGMWLPMDYVKTLCDHPDWTVNVIDDQLTQTIANLAVSAIAVPKL